MKIAPKGCPICGFPDFGALDEAGCNTFEICPACGCESGYEYQDEVTDEHFVSIRRHWLYEKKGRWWSELDASPPGWNAEEQMKKAGIPIPLPT
jgi:hypothetical protein